MIKGVAILLGFQLAGEVVTRLGQLPVSGPILGMAALLVWFHFRGEVDGEVGKVGDGILANMALLFVPVGVGAMSFSALFLDAWPVILIAIVAGAGVTLLTTAFVARIVSRWTTCRAGEPEDRVQRQAR